MRTKQVSSAHQVSCVNKDPGYDPHLRVRVIGGREDNGTRWKVAVSEAIRGIEAGRWRFYVKTGRDTIPVVVAEHEGCKYLKTEADDYSPDNLLALPECP